MNNEVLIICITIFLVISSVFVVNSSNPVFSLLFLILSFIYTFFILLLLDCEFLAFIFLIIYIGAIVILFIFVLILLNIKFQNLNLNIVSSILLYYIFIITIFFFIVYVKFSNLLFCYYQLSILKPIYFLNWKFVVNYSYKIKVYSLILYTNFIFEFLIIGIILLLILIGIVFIVNNYLSLNIKIQTNSKQVFIRSKFFY